MVSKRKTRIVLYFVFANWVWSILTRFYDQLGITQITFVLSVVALNIGFYWLAKLFFERFISVIHDVSSKIDDKSALIALFRHQFNNDKSLISNPLNDYMFYDLKSHILAAIG